VFPGGNCDEDDGSHRVTAIRETFEEAGLLLAKTCPASTSERPTPQQLDQDALNSARRSILLGQTAFGKFLQDAGLTPAVDELLPFTEWITPVQLPRCDIFALQLFDVYVEKGVGDSMPGFMSPSCTIHRSLASLTEPNENLSPPLMAGRKSSLPGSFTHPRRCKRLG